MAKTKISEFSTTAGNNTDINSINIAEGCAPSGINDAIRELMRQLKEFQTGGAGDSVNSGGDFSVATNKFTVASASGNTAVAGTLAVTGTTTLTGALVANGNATLGDGSGDTVTVKGTPTLEVNPTLSGGTANGVLYLNGSKVATSGSALTFDGTNLTVANGDLTIGTNGKKLYVNYIANNSGTDLNVNGSTNSIFTIAGSEAMRLTSTSLYTASGINVGIGTSSPAGRLSVKGSTSDSSANALFVEDSSSAGIFRVRNDGDIYMGNGGKAILDSSGNLGLGVTPNAWGSGLKAFQASTASFMGDGTATYVSSNYYYNAGNKYIGNGYATSYQTYNGQHVWLTAGNNVSGAGAAITFTQALTLDASGNLGVGTTSPGTRLQLNGTDGTSGLFIQKAGAAQSFFGAESTWLASGTSANTVLATYGSTNILFGIAGTERARIDSSGNLLVNTTSTLASAHQTIACTAGSGSKIPLALQVGVTTDGYTAVSLQNQAGAQGSISVNTSSVSYNTTSDQRLKENIVDAPEFGSVIDSIKVRSYDWKADGNHQRAGFVAQELVTVAPEAVHQPADPEQMMAVDYSKLVPMLVKEIQSLRARVAQLESN